MESPNDAIEWKVDKNGRKYREVARGFIEYEMEINGIPQSAFVASQKAFKEARKAEFAAAEQRAREEAARQRNCPFKDSSGNTKCRREECALFVNGCFLARFKPAKDTEGLLCPLNKYNFKCRKDCALYNSGCTLIGMTTHKESEDQKDYE